MTQQSDDDLRSYILDAGKRVQPEIVEVDGKRYAVRAPTATENDEATEHAGITFDQATGQTRIKSPSKMNIALAIACVSNPDTGKPLFSVGDFAALCKLPAGSIVETLGSKAAELAKQEIKLGKPSAEAAAES